MQKIYPCDNEMRCNVSSVYKLLKYLDQLCNDFTAICSDAADATNFPAVVLTVTLKPS